MKNLLLITVFIFTSLILKAQEVPDYAAIKLEAKADYTPEADKAALSAATYLLSMPLDKENMSRQKSARYLVRWMTGSPTYSFSLGEPVTKISKGNPDLLMVYMAGMAKFCLENPLECKEDKKVKLKAVQTMLKYCKDFHVKQNNELKKMNDANEKGELEKYLG